ncbi:hypothetical protein FOXB_17072 [Fusarium oxysporum f. sp. conglutinans Fo5176]|uniref:Uncharacterized protein n=1 Tax=Fusarium oxysporum (strain Fo5176) TaxID=660025 RepID=F9GEI8_FUSOF|nr:hypothetical protein FOXB_17072 [Fusarium oxysporum f. sp. conglutinans Fo5176]
MYGSMVVYFKKRSEAKEFIGEGLSWLEESSTPQECLNAATAQNNAITANRSRTEMYQCERPQVCGKCARGAEREEARTGTRESGQPQGYLGCSSVGHPRTPSTTDPRKAANGANGASRVAQGGVMTERR